MSAADPRAERALQQLAKIRAAWAIEAQRADRLAVLCAKLQRLAERTRWCAGCQGVAEEADELATEAADALMRCGR